MIDVTNDMDWPRVDADSFRPVARSAKDADC